MHLDSIINIAAGILLAQLVVPMVVVAIIIVCYVIFGGGAWVIEHIERSKKLAGLHIHQ